MGALYLPVLFQLLSSEVGLIGFGYLIRLFDLLNHFLMKIGLPNYSLMKIYSVGKLKHY